jgi:DNA repair photolyase
MPIFRLKNPPQQFTALQIIHDEGEEPLVETSYYHDATRSVLNKNTSPDMRFQWSLNPYRGCAHNCAYCYARPTHEYLGLGAGSDFASRIFIKPDTPQLLRKSIHKVGKGPIFFSGVTDCYQPIEKKLQLTRACLEICADAGVGVALVTKSALVERDVDVLCRLQQHASLLVMLSIPILDPECARIIEPGAPTPQRRLKAITTLTQGGIHVGVMVAPVIPGLSDTDIPAILNEAKNAGARCAAMTMLRLPKSTKDVFTALIQEHFPQRAEKILHRIEESHQGKLDASQFHKRFQEYGSYAQMIRSVFELHVRRLGLNFIKSPEDDSSSSSSSIKSKTTSHTESLLPISSDTFVQLKHNKEMQKSHITSRKRKSHMEESTSQPLLPF